MSCESYRESWDAYLDGELPPAERRRLERHLSGCLACRREVEELRELAAATRRLPESIDPPRELWPEIARQIEPAAPARPRRAFLGRWPYAAAAALLALALTLPLWMSGRRPEPQPAATAAAPAPEAGLAVASVEDGMVHAYSDLEVSIESQRGEMAPETLKTVEENVRILEEAVAQIRAALAEHPDDRRLNLLLATRYQQEVDMLKRVYRL